MQKRRQGYEGWRDVEIHSIRYLTLRQHQVHAFRPQQYLLAVQRAVAPSSILGYIDTPRHSAVLSQQLSCEHTVFEASQA
ncbi:hypothetical protein AMS68_003051 [Peltaster fructicola]|uniref:Uncharacterized protein n=1 Tax=Peltaster fructicola TaxID=286661 RepID=A0A6H0XS22_9PEZI|nr:hypothetical protein AMS68_003051 [Peltaster fructicola]